MPFLENMFPSGQSRHAQIMRNEKTNLMVQSDSTRSERILQEKHLKIKHLKIKHFKAFHSYLAPIEQHSSHTWTPLCSMFHSYLDPYITNVPLMSGPHRPKCSIHTWTTPI